MGGGGGRVHARTYTLPSVGVFLSIKRAPRYFNVWSVGNWVTACSTAGGLTA